MIYNSILKHGYSSFSLEILEYCDGDQAISREQYFLDLLNPEYNILKKAGSRLGSKHSSEAIAKMKNRILTVEQKAKHREHLARLNLRPEQKEHLKRLNLSQKGRARPEGAGKPNISIEVFDSLNNETTIYSSIREAAIGIGVDRSSISNAFKLKGESTVLMKNKRYKLTKLP